jgi:quercetin dioxygenase-like cupin family protein
MNGLEPASKSLRPSAAMPAPGFVSLGIENGLLLDLRDGVHPTRVYGFAGGLLDLPAGDTHYGMVTEGMAWLDYGADRFPLRAGTFFVAPGRAHIEGRAGHGLIISRLGYRGLFQIGGPLEARGRLRYIDGCTDTLLVSPPRLGEPCLNHLHIPPGTDQSAHTHPSERIGVIVAGRGTCVADRRHSVLAPGMAWRIRAGCVHSFQTAEESLDVLAWHPDSDCGPTDENHPMLNRTFLNRPDGQ